MLDKNKSAFSEIKWEESELVQKNITFFQPRYDRLPVLGILWASLKTCM